MQGIKQGENRVLGKMAHPRHAVVTAPSLDRRAFYITGKRKRNCRCAVVRLFGNTVYDVRGYSGCRHGRQHADAGLQRADVDKSCDDLKNAR